VRPSGVQPASATTHGRDRERGQREHDDGGSGWWSDQVDTSSGRAIAAADVLGAGLAWQADFA